MNDFTQTPAFATVSDLNSLVDKNSGLAPRTFVGPTTFLLNSNGGSLRPTDNLDEAYCETDDCNTMDFFSADQYQKIPNFGYEKSPYHGSIAHFHKVTFNDYKDVDPKTGVITEIKGLETMFRELEAEKKARKKVEGSSDTVFRFF